MPVHNLLMESRRQLKLKTKGLVTDMSKQDTHLVPAVSEKNIVITVTR